MAIVCLPLLRPIYRLVVKGSVKSTQQNGYHTASWNGKPNLQTLNTLKKPYSDSTRQLAVIDGDGNKSFTEALDDSSRSTDTTSEMGNVSPTKTHKAGNVITVKNDVDIKLSTHNGAAHV
jgi:hypothetical protein